MSAPTGGSHPAPGHGASTALVGTWDLALRTPIGRLSATVAFREDGGVLTGTAAGRGETVPLRDVRAVPDARGLRVSWSQTITTPLRLHLVFDVVVDGDAMTGLSRAGRLPATSVSGTRADGR
jgi:hypothetical protein